MNRKVVIPYTPRYPQDEIHKQLESHRFSVLVAHRRLGKTVLAINHLIKRAIIDKKVRGFYAYLAPFRNQAKQNAWEYLKHYTAPIPYVKVNESELSIKLPNEATIRIFGADNPDALRGTYFDGVVLDEVAQMKPFVWGEIIRPALADRNGWAVFIGTPKGINLFSELYDKALALGQKEDGEWAAMLYSVDQTGVINEKELASLREEMSENEFRQEFLCDFNAANDNSLISVDLVREAIGRHYRETEYKAAPLIFGVDVARFGNDSTVIFKRQGLVSFDPIIIKKFDSVQVADLVAMHIDKDKPDAVFIDAGQGHGVIDHLRRSLGYKVTEVPFGASAIDSDHYANRRIEMWDKMAKWLQQGGAIPPSTLLQADLTAPTYGYTVGKNLKILESKDKIKERIGRSPDCFVEGTLILTDKGQVPIEEIKEGDFVVTPTGKVRVIKVWDTLTEELTEVLFSDGRILIGKPKHGIVLKGYGNRISMDSLTMTNEIASASLKEFLLWNILNSLSTKGSSTDFKQRVATTKAGTKIRRRDFFIDASGWTTTALFLRGCRYITRTVTGLITGWKIWNLSMRASIRANTCSSGCPTQNTEKTHLNRLNWRRMLHVFGTHQKRDVSGTFNTDENYGNQKSQSKQFALCAEKSSRRTFQRELGSVLMRASRKKVISAIKLLKGYVHSVGNLLDTTNIGIRPVAVEHVQTKCVQPTRVLNLTLESENVFYANGVLVENCADALALTFAAPVRSRHENQKIQGRSKAYDPMKAFEQQWRR